MIRPLKENRDKQVQFIASASHELRSPLTVITSSLSALKIAGKEDFLRFIHAMESEAGRMARLINDMLTLLTQMPETGPFTVSLWNWTPWYWKLMKI